MVHDKRSRFSEALVPEEIGCSESGAVIGSGGLDVQLPERSVRANLAIRDTIHGAASGQAKVRQLRALPQSVEHVKGAGFVDRLQGAGDVFVEFGERFQRIAGGAEKALQFW